MVGITGHHIEPDTRPGDVGGLSKIGLSICFASLLAAIQFGIAGWYLSEGLDTDSRYITAAVTAVQFKRFNSVLHERRSHQAGIHAQEGFSGT